MADEKNLPTDENEELEEYEPQIIELDGEQFEVIDAVCYDGQNYVALVPYTESDEDEDEDEVEFIILKEVEENGEYMLATIDDEDLYNEVGEVFIEHISEVFGDDECDCDDCK